MIFAATHPSLRTVQPSPTTISYTVSTVSARTSSLGGALQRIRLVLRIILAVFCLLLLISLLGVWSHMVWGLRRAAGIELGDLKLGFLWQEWARVVALARSDGFEGKLTGMICVGMLYALGRRGYTEESLLIIRGLGIQTSTSSQSLLSSAATRFIPTAQIQDIFIHEAFKGFEVRFYLAVIIEGEDDAVVVFPKLLPRREILEEVWKGSREVLYARGSALLGKG